MPDDKMRLPPFLFDPKTVAPPALIVRSFPAEAAVGLRAISRVFAASPAIDRMASGLVVPIPTFPEPSIVTRVRLLVFNPSLKLSLVPKVASAPKLFPPFLKLPSPVRP